MPSSVPTATRYRVAFHDSLKKLSKQVRFTRERDAREFYVRLVTSPHIGFAELAIVQGVKVVEVLATHFPDETGGAS